MLSTITAAYMGLRRMELPRMGPTPIRPTSMAIPSQTGHTWRDTTEAPATIQTTTTGRPRETSIFIPGLRVVARKTIQPRPTTTEADTLSTPVRAEVNIISTAMGRRLMFPNADNYAGLLLI